MKKFGVLSAGIFLSILIAGAYGIIHDQITYSISPEYFTKFKFQQFGFEPQQFGSIRQTVAMIGFLATWWTGLIIGLILGFTSLIMPDHKTMRRALVRAIATIFCIAVLTGFAGFLFGRYFLSEGKVDWWFPEDLVDKRAFITVGSIHNFSYLGGLGGLVPALIVLFHARYRYNKERFQETHEDGE